MAENFNLIFGQNASQQYAWNDADYQNGWETIGNIPPTAAQFDALQRRADTKAQELNSRLTAVEQSIAGGGGQKREADTTYAVGDVVTYDGLPMDWVLVCIVGGTSGSADITLPSPRVEGARILDGTVTWALRKIATYGGIGYRQSSTSYYTGSLAFSTALPTGWYLECTGTGGITSASDLVIASPTVGATVTDGAVVWTIRAIASTADIPAPVDISGKANVDLDNLSAAGEAKIQSVSPRYLTDSYYNANGNWWRKYSDGWVEQGGIATTGTFSNPGTVTLLLAMANTNYTLTGITVVPKNSSGKFDSHLISVYFGDATTTSFKTCGARNGETGGNYSFRWLVCGKGA